MKGQAKSAGIEKVTARSQGIKNINTASATQCGNESGKPSERQRRSSKPSKPMVG